MDLASKLPSVRLTGKNLLAAAFVVSLLAGTAYSAGSNTYGIDINQGSLRMHGNSINNAVLGTSLAAGGNKITNLADPSNAQDAATMSWVNNNDDDASTTCSGSNYLAGDGTCTSDTNTQLDDEAATSNVNMNGNYIYDSTGLELLNQGDSIHQDGMPENRLVLDIDQNKYQDYGLSSSSGLYLSSRSTSNDIHLIGDINNGNYKCTLDASTGDWNCDGTKNWVHSLNSTHDAYYTSQESPQVRAVYEGKAYLDTKKKIELPDHFSKTVSDEEPKLRATVTVQGKLAYASVIEKTDDYIVLESSEPADVNFRITGIRDGYEDKKVVREK